MSIVPRVKAADHRFGKPYPTTFLQPNAIRTQVIQYHNQAGRNKNKQTYKIRWQTAYRYSIVVYGCLDSPSSHNTSDLQISNHQVLLLSLVRHPRHKAHHVPATSEVLRTGHTPVDAGKTMNMRGLVWNSKPNWTGNSPFRAVPNLLEGSSSTGEADENKMDPNGSHMAWQWSPVAWCGSRIHDTERDTNARAVLVLTEIREDHIVPASWKVRAMDSHLHPWHHWHYHH